MDLPHTGSLNQAVELLRVDTELFTLFLQGRPYHPTVETLQLHRSSSQEWVSAQLGLDCSERLGDVQIKVFSPEVGGMVEWQQGVSVFPCFYETQSYELVIQNKTAASLSFYHENVLLRQAVKPLGDSILAGVLNFGNEVGLTEWEVRSNGQTLLRVEMEIFPSKMDYKLDYQNILNEVNAQIYNLAFDFLRRTYQLTGLRETQHQSLTEFFTILQHVFRQLLDAVERINKNPNYALLQDRRLMDANRVKKAGRENIRELAKHPERLRVDESNGFLRINGQNYTATHLMENRRRLSYDTNENRFIRWMLERIHRKLKELKARWKENSRTPDPLLIKRLDAMLTQLERVLKMDFLREAGVLKQMSVTLVLQMAPGYREVYRCYLMLLKGLSIQGDLFRLSMKDVAQLYEYWCFLKLNQLLGQKYKLVKQDIIKVNRNGIFVTLDRSQSAKMVYENPVNGEQFILYYNSIPSSDKTPTLSQRPDNVLTLKKKDAGTVKEYKYVFDAKYRLNPAYEGTSYHRSYGHPGPEEDDINTMHRYRDAIVYQEKGTGEYERSMFGAYVLFPYPDEERYKSHQFYKSIELLNIGALPFLPNSTSLVEQFLDEIIQDSPEKAYERSTRPRGTKEYYANQLAGKNVLVGSVRGPEQVEVARRHCFYHVPLKNLASQKIITQIEYVAMCQSRRKFFDPAKTGIHWVGKVVDWEVVKRKEIKEIIPEPYKEERDYVRFTVEEWLPVKPYIALGGQGILTVLYTSKYVLDRALEIAELRLETEEDLREWREKRRKGRVKVKLDHEEYVDLGKVVEVRSI
ncbi:restriction endonuclease-like protein [Paenibacillus graminis]|uniref:restriction endonuclease-like protein n=1 Tax=Paenibacillus graminis TaxID=189425 RepID=UPI002DBE9066|nr:restriction endonuclease-like protein [Paenibacillus graminis]MEC0169128.1 restriction endonuclease-like protein [Paenibacillus graminis]